MQFFDNWLHEKTKTKQHVSGRTMDHYAVLVGHILFYLQTAS